MCEISVMRITSRQGTARTFEAYSCFELVPGVTVIGGRIP